MPVLERLKRTLCFFLFIVHGGAIVFTALPKTSAKANVQPKLELPGIWPLESVFVKVSEVNPLLGVAERYNRFFGFGQNWSTFSPNPPFTQSRLRVATESENGSVEVLWSSQRSIYGSALTSMRMNKFLDHLMKEELVSYVFLYHFWQRRPRAKRIVLLQEQLSVPMPGRPTRSTGERVIFQVTPADIARQSQP